MHLELQHPAFTPKTYRSCHFSYKGGQFKSAEGVNLDQHKGIISFSTRGSILSDFPLGLQKELNAIGNNFNQVVKRVYSLKGFDAFQQWYVELEVERWQVLNHVEKINQKLGQISDEWLR